MTSGLDASTLSSVSPPLRPSPLAVSVLGLLVIGPLHPYGMQRLIKLWGKDQVVNVGQRASLYKTIKRLREAGLIAVHQTERDQQFPERTLYELTDEGRRRLMEWLGDMLSAPRNEFPEFPGALSFAMLLAPDEARAVLERRADLLSDTLTGLDRDLAGEAARLPRVAMLETEYLRTVTAAELAWVRGVIDDLRTGALSWSYEELADMARSFLPER
jgi:DNA-binding PadR family transcriptional regulator